jgi:hypothetical protein
VGRLARLSEAVKPDEGRSGPLEFEVEEWHCKRAYRARATSKRPSPRPS